MSGQGIDPATAARADLKRTFLVGAFAGLRKNEMPSHRPTSEVERLRGIDRRGT